MVNDGSSQSGGKTQFDLQSQAGVLKVLTSIRNSDLSADDRNELRDLVFLFANGGGDAAVRETLEDRLVALGLTKPIADTTATSAAGAAPETNQEPAVEEVKTSSGFAGSRPTPTFSASPAPTPVATSEAHSHSAAEKPAASPAPTQATTSAPAAAAAVPGAADTPTPKATPAKATMPPRPLERQQSASAQPQVQPKPPSSPANPSQSPQSAQPTPKPVPTQPANTAAASLQSATPVGNPVEAPTMPPTPAQPSVQTAPSKPQQSAGSAPVPPPVQPKTATPATPPAQPAPPPPVAPPSAQAQGTTEPPPQNQNILNRIREIKADVNARVGNPVNLVDIDSEAGREYMNALLEAMRSVSGGTPQTAQAALNRLETVYKKILPLVDAHAAGKSESETPASVPPPRQPEPTNPPSPATPQVNSGWQQTPPADSQTSPKIPMNEPSAATSSMPAAAAPTSGPSPQPIPTNPQAAPSNNTDTPAFTPNQVPNASAPQSQPAPPARPATAPGNTPVMPPATPAAQADTAEEEPEESASPWAQALKGLKLRVTSSKDSDEPEEQPPAKAPHSDANTPQTLSPQSNSAAALNAVTRAESITENKVPLRKPSDLPDINEKVAAEHGNDPLYSKAVDDGLEQLLQEWDLFKKSGFLGRGPKGREHPLFKQLAPLQIPLILAGRFEGANQEIKQSVTDYMNGWRYEQGIIYEPGETFEHYLRRVITHILGIES